MLTVGKSMIHINALKNQLSREFAMKDLGVANHILSMMIERDRSKRLLWLSQEKYIKICFKSLGCIVQRRC